MSALTVFVHYSLLARHQQCVSQLIVPAHCTVHNREGSRKWQPGGQVARKKQAGEAVVMVAKVVVVVVEVVVTLVGVVSVVANMREREWQAIVTRRGG